MTESGGLFANSPDGQVCHFAGVVIALALHIGPRGRFYATGTLAVLDDGEDVPFVAPPAVYESHGGDTLALAATVTVTGRVDRRGDTPELTILEVWTR